MEVQDGVYTGYKKRGETLAVFVERFRLEKSISADAKLTYAGRLDPMAEGVVLLLVGHARFEKDAYLGLPKVYEAEVVFGITTDSLDDLGIIESVDEKKIDQKMILESFETLASSLVLPYPMYASKPVDGKPLFEHARSSAIIDLPTFTAQIFEKELLSIKNISGEALANEAIEGIKKVVGDFRQEECIASWNAFKETQGKHMFSVATIRLTVSGGTYIRSIAAYLGEKIGSCAYAHTIKRISYKK